MYKRKQEHKSALERLKIQQAQWKRDGVRVHIDIDPEKAQGKTEEQLAKEILDFLSEDGKDITDEIL